MPLPFCPDWSGLLEGWQQNLDVNLALPDPTLAPQPVHLLSLGCAVGFLLTQGCFPFKFLFLRTQMECWIRQCDVQHSALGSPGTCQCATPAQTTVSRDSITEQASSGSDVRDFFGLWTTCHLCCPPIFNGKEDEDSKDVPEKSGCRC